MNCPICRDLKRAFVARFAEYREARSSACYRVTTEFAAQKNVDFERARYELEEHRLVCVAVAGSIAPLPEQHVAAPLNNWRRRRVPNWTSIADISHGLAQDHATSASTFVVELPEQKAAAPAGGY